MEHCRVSSDLRGYEVAQALGIKEWIAACPAMRDTAQQEVCKMIAEGDSHPLWLKAVESHYLQTDDGAERLAACMAFFANKGAALPAEVDEFVTQLANTVVDHMFGSGENIASICEDGYRIGLFVSEITASALGGGHAN